jgi:hypothetical protein
MGTVHAFHAADEPTFHCLDCLDEPSGWAETWCRGYGDKRIAVADKPASVRRVETGDCGRTFPHGPHTAVRRCHCYETNPVRARLRERIAKARAEREAQAPRRPR